MVERAISALEEGIDSLLACLEPSYSPNELQKAQYKRSGSCGTLSPERRRITG
jgi:hypothetical protein